MTDQEYAIGLGWQTLACRVLEQAYRDSQNTNGQGAAREIGLSAGLTLASDSWAFLRSDGARWLMGLLDLEPGMLDRVMQEMPEPEWGHLVTEL